MRRGFLPRILATLLILQVGAPALAAERSVDPLSHFQIPAHRQVPTDAPSEPVSVKLTSNWSLYGLTQSDYYDLAVAAGALEIAVAGDPKSSRADLILSDAETGHFLLFESVDGRSGQTFSVEIAEPSHLALIILQNQLAAVTLTGPGLQATPGTPAPVLPLAPYQTINTEATIQPTLMNPDETGMLVAYLDYEGLGKNLVQSDGSVAPFTIDTRRLPDEIYPVSLLGFARESGNQSWLEQYILVDRTPAFEDVSMAHWAHHPIEVMYHAGIINGRAPAHFAPDEAVTRAEFAKMVVGALNLPMDDEPKIPFADVPYGWSYWYIAALYKAGLVQGERVDGRLYFYPDRTITRAEAATILGRALNQAEATDYSPPFTDWATVPTWAQPAVANMAKRGWLSGFPDGSYQPAAQLTRAQAARVLSRFMGM